MLMVAAGRVESVRGTLNVDLDAVQLWRRMKLRINGRLRP